MKRNICDSVRLNYFVIPAIIVLVAFAGGYFTQMGMDWYATLLKPAWIPGGRFISTVWTVIYILYAIMALIVWNTVNHKTRRFWWIVVLFAANLVLNSLWSFIWFVGHWMVLAMLGMIILNLTVVALMFLIWPLTRMAVLLLVPYFAWVSFATYLACRVWQMNS